ncbi:MAG TPA: acetolactate synthase [Rhodobacteraceae bacterium]|nr:acetolactate synthase [Paracoccaceae bacterium]
MASETSITLPSGRQVVLLDVIRGMPEQTDSWFFRFLDPTLGPNVDFGALEPDMQALCEDVALSQIGKDVARVTIALLDREVPFGTAAPGAVQVFEAYSVDGQNCEWEPF